MKYRYVRVLISGVIKKSPLNVPQPRMNKHTFNSCSKCSQVIFCLRVLTEPQIVAQPRSSCHEASASDLWLSVALYCRLVHEKCNNVTYVLSVDLVSRQFRKQLASVIAMKVGYVEPPSTALIEVNRFWNCPIARPAWNVYVTFLCTTLYCSVLYFCCYVICPCSLFI